MGEVSPFDVNKVKAVGLWNVKTHTIEVTTVSSSEVMQVSAMRRCFDFASRHRRGGTFISLYIMIQESPDAISGSLKEQDTQASLPTCAAAMSMHCCDFSSTQACLSVQQQCQCGAVTEIVTSTRHRQACLSVQRQ